RFRHDTTILISGTCNNVRSVGSRQPETRPSSIAATRDAKVPAKRRRESGPRIATHRSASAAGVPAAAHSVDGFSNGGSNVQKLDNTPKRAFRLVEETVLCLGAMSERHKRV